MAKGPCEFHQGAPTRLALQPTDGTRPAWRAFAVSDDHPPETSAQVLAAADQASVDEHARPDPCADHNAHAVIYAP